MKLSKSCFRAVFFRESGRQERLKELVPVESGVGTVIVGRPDSDLLVPHAIDEQTRTVKSVKVEHPLGMLGNVACQATLLTEGLPKARDSSEQVAVDKLLGPELASAVAQTDERPRFPRRRHLDNR